MIASARILADGRVTIPNDIREELGLEVGDTVVIVVKPLLEVIRERNAVDGINGGIYE